jgi:hypothetical protein
MNATRRQSEGGNLFRLVGDQAVKRSAPHPSVPLPQSGERAVPVEPDEGVADSRLKTRPLSHGL